MSEEYTGDGTEYLLDLPSHGNCNLMWTPSWVKTTYAALNEKQWMNLANCGRCASVRCIDTRCLSSASRIVMIVDRCPECQYGDLDLSPSIFYELTGQRSTRLKISWSFVPCPVQGPVNICVKGGANEFWMALQPTNVDTGVRSLHVNGRSTSLLGSCYYFKVDGAAQVPMENMNVSITFLNSTIQQFNIANASAGACTNGYREVEIDGSTPRVDGNINAIFSPHAPLIPFLIVASLLSIGALLYTFRRRIHS